MPSVQTMAALSTLPESRMSAVLENLRQLTADLCPLRVLFGCPAFVKLL